jgi:hypothetical protein
MVILNRGIVAAMKMSVAWTSTLLAILLVGLPLIFADDTGEPFA